MGAHPLVTCFVEIGLIIIINSTQPAKPKTKTIFQEISYHFRHLSSNNSKLQVINRLTVNLKAPTSSSVQVTTFMESSFQVTYQQKSIIINLNEMQFPLNHNCCSC